MKRRLLIIGIFLLLGAVVNVAVAWCYAVGGWLPEGHHPTVELDRTEAKQVFADRLAVVAGPAGGYEERCVGRTLLVVNIDPPDLADHQVQVLTTGWPCLALEGDWGLVDGQSKAGGLIITPWERNHQAVAFPFRPISPGFAVNTIFYATLLWLLMYGLSALRRFVRVRRGLCPKCAYPMGESSVCKECGKALPKRTVS